MGDVILFPGISELGIDVDGVLESAKSELSEAVVVGYDKEGQFYFAGSMSGGGTALALLMIAQKRLLEIMDAEE